VTSRFISKGNVIQEKDINGKITTLPVLKKRSRHQLQR